MDITQAMIALRPNILAHLEAYHVGDSNESTTLPQALWTSREELRALAYVIRTLPVALKLLKDATDYITTCKALEGHAYNQADAEAAVARTAETLGEIAIGRSAVPMASVDLGLARALTGQPGYARIPPKW